MEISLDLGRHLGYCIRFDNGTYKTGCKDLAMPSGKGDKYAYYINLNKFLLKCHHTELITKIYIELVTFSTNTYATQAHGAYKAEVGTFARTRMIPVKEIPVSTVKKKLTGRGNASKAGMIHYAEKWLGISIFDDNEADAVGVMYAGRNGKK